jgi:hypothetical protein
VAFPGYAKFHFCPLHIWPVSNAPQNSPRSSLTTTRMRRLFSPLAIRAVSQMMICMIWLPWVTRSCPPFPSASTNCNAVNDDETVASAIIRAARTSMGRDLSEMDMEIVMSSATRTSELAVYRKRLASYLGSRMNQVAPNLAALIGDTVGARLISKAGSLTNLSK